MMAEESSDESAELVDKEEAVSAEKQFTSQQSNTGMLYQGHRIIDKLYMYISLDVCFYGGWVLLHTNTVKVIMQLPSFTSRGRCHLCCPSMHCFSHKQGPE